VPVVIEWADGGIEISGDLAGDLTPVSIRASRYSTTKN